MKIVKIMRIIETIAKEKIKKNNKTKETIKQKKIFLNFTILGR